MCNCTENIASFATFSILKSRIDKKNWSLVRRSLRWHFFLFFIFCFKITSFYGQLCKWIFPNPKPFKRQIAQTYKTTNQQTTTLPSCWSGAQVEFRVARRRATNQSPISIMESIFRKLSAPGYQFHPPSPPCMGYNLKGGKKVCKSSRRNQTFFRFRADFFCDSIDQCNSHDGGGVLQAGNVYQFDFALFWVLFCFRYASLSCRRIFCAVEIFACCEIVKRCG